MKKYIVISLLAIFCLFGFKKGDEVITVSGKIKVKDIHSVILCSTEEASWKNMDTCKVAPDGTFSFTIKNPKSGIWSIVSATKMRFTKSYYVKFYVSKNEKINILVNDTWENYSLTGKLSKENNLFYKWNKIYSEMFDVTQTYKELYPKVDGFIAKAEELKKEINTSNKEFNELLINIVNYDIDKGMVAFKASPNTIHPSDNEVHPIYAKIFKRQKFDNNNILDYPDGYNLMHIVAMYKSMDFMKTLSEKEKDELSYFNLSLQQIASNKLKGVYFSKNIENYETYEELMKDYEQYGNLLWSDNQKSKFEKFKKNKQRFMKGQPAFNFTYPDASGKKISLSDLKGKVVLVDVWATWCLPCKQQIPSLKALEKELHGKNIEFVGISVDTEDNKQAWLNMVKKEELKGIQLFAGKFGGSSICADYEITGIPRFMIFDKDGTIYSINAPRPSDPKLKEILLELTK